jgi:phytoene desaturase
MLAVTDDAGAQKPHAVIIGSGFGGLAAAIRLGARGYRVTVLERLDQPGGRARVFRQDGFTFDAGPTVITAPFLFEELWTLCGRRMEDDVALRPISPYYRIRFNNGEVFDYTGDRAQMRAEIARFSPDDADGYDRFMQASAAIYRTGFEELGDVPFGRFTDMLRVAPALIKNRAYRSVYGFVSRFVKDERIRTVLSYHPLLIGGNPFDASAIYALIAHLERAHGVHYTMGGTGALVQGLVGLIRGQRGTLRTRAEVSRILLNRRKAVGVMLTTGEEIAADIVVSNADSAWMYKNLLPARARRRWTNRKLARSRYSMGLFVWYFGTRRLYTDVAHHSILLGPRYRGLLNDIFSRKILATDFSLYLHRPTATDAAMAPAGHDAFYVLSPVPNLAGGTDWGHVGENYRRAIEHHLEHTIMPGLGANIVTSRIMTPDDFQNDLLSVHGAGFGLEPILTQSAWFRPHNRSEDIENLFLVGAGTHPGGGLPGVLSSARILDKVVPNIATIALRESGARHV